MSETKGPSTTVPPSMETSSSQAANVSSPVPEQQPRTAEPVEQAALHTADPIEPSLTSERVQNVAGFDTSNEAAPVQGQNMATGGFRSSSGVPSEDELNQLYTSEVGVQVRSVSCCPPLIASALSGLIPKLCSSAYCASVQQMLGLVYVGFCICCIMLRFCLVSTEQCLRLPPLQHLSSEHANFTVAVCTRLGPGCMPQSLVWLHWQVLACTNQ